MPTTCYLSPSTSVLPVNATYLKQEFILAKNGSRGLNCVNLVVFRYFWDARVLEWDKILFGNFTKKTYAERLSFHHVLGFEYKLRILWQKRWTLWRRHTCRYKPIFITLNFRILFTYPKMCSDNSYFLIKNAYSNDNTVLRKFKLNCSIALLS